MIGGATVCDFVVSCFHFSPAGIVDQIDCVHSLHHSGIPAKCDDQCDVTKAQMMRTIDKLEQVLPGARTLRMDTLQTLRRSCRCGNC